MTPYLECLNYIEVHQTNYYLGHFYESHSFCLGLSLSLLSCKPVVNSDSSGVSGTSEVNALNCNLLEPSGGKPSIEMSILPEPYEPEEQSVKLRLGGAPEVLELAYYKSEGKENTEQHVFLKKIYHGGVHEWLEVRYSLPSSAQ